MNVDSQVVKVAVVQAASVMFDRQACLDKLRNLTREAASQGAQLVLFPEAFIPGYPRGLSFGTVVGSRQPGGRAMWERYWRESIADGGGEFDAIADIARDEQVFLVVGVIERDGFSGGTLYCSMFYFGPDGAFLGKHRKLKPTGSERIIWGEGDGSTMPVIDTSLGKLGGLICWENYMPLARAALYGKGVSLFLAPTADSRDSWQATMRHIACEGRCVVLGSNQFVTRSMYPDDLHSELEHQPEIMCRGGSVIVGPLGDVIAGPLWDEEGILYADLDMGAIARARFDFDVVGHYARPDIFELKVDERSKAPVSFE